MEAHVHAAHLLTCSKDWIKSHGWQSGVAALQRQAKPGCIKPEHRAPWAWPVKCYHTHLPGERLGFITHIRWQLSGPVHLRPAQVSWFSFCHRCFIFFGKNCWSKMLLAHQQACHSLPVTSIRESLWTQAALPCISAQEQWVPPLASLIPLVNELFSYNCRKAGDRSHWAPLWRGEAWDVAGQRGQWSHIFHYVCVCNQGWFHTV